MVNIDKLQEAGRLIIEAIGEDASREGLIDTPRRFAYYWKEFIDYDSGNHDTVFEWASADAIVTVKDIDVYSVCEHHLLPFYCRLAIAYIPATHVVGLSKIVRIATAHAHSLQLQERLCYNIARELQSIAQTDDVAVVVQQSTHLCIAMRGVTQPHASCSTSVMLGAFRTEGNARTEVLSIINGR